MCFAGSGPLLAFGLVPFCGGFAARSRPWELSPAFVLELAPRKLCRLRTSLAVTVGRGGVPRANLAMDVSSDGVFHAGIAAYAQHFNLKIHSRVSGISTSETGLHCSGTPSGRLSFDPFGGLNSLSDLPTCQGPFAGYIKLVHRGILFHVPVFLEDSLHHSLARVFGNFARQMCLWSQGQRISRALRGPWCPCYSP